MWRLIVLAILVWVVITVIKKMFKHSSLDDEVTDKVQNNQTQQDENQAIVKCNHCELHILKSEALTLRGQFYCSKAHLPDTTPDHNEAT